MKKTKWMNKKGTILGDIGSFISSVLDLIPRPIKLLFFLFLLFAIGNIIQWSLQIFGIFCDSADNPVKINENILVTMDVLGKSAEFLAQEGREAGKSIGGEIIDIGCSLYTETADIYSADVDFTRDSLLNFESQSTTPRYWYLNLEHCSVCQGNTVYLKNMTGYDNLMSFIQITLPNAELFYGALKVCDSDVTRNNESNGLWDIYCWYKENTGTSYCVPPKNYKYSYRTNTYICAVPECQPEAVLHSWDALLQKYHAELIYGGTNDTTQQKRDYTSFAGVSCSKNRPQISVFGFPIFDYKIWLLLFIIIIIYWMIKNL